jgi:urease accessory protein UreF
MRPRSLGVLYALVDGRVTAGGPGYAESLQTTRIDDLNGLRLFLLGHIYGRLRTDRALASEACRLGPSSFDTLAFEADVRASSTVGRDAARWRGRRMLSLARRTWGDLMRGWTEDLPEPVALGAIAWASGAHPDESDALALHAGVAEPAWAFGRRLRLDPRDVTTLVVDLCAAAPPPSPPGIIPAADSPLAEAAAQVRERRQTGPNPITGAHPTAW